MGKKNRRGKSNKDKKKAENISTFSRNELIDIHAEAYYKALKKIESEKKINVEEEKAVNYSIWEKIKIILRFIFVPFTIKIEESEENSITNNVFSFISSFIIYVIGGCLWLIGLVFLISIVKYTFLNFSIEIIWKLILVALGSTVIMAFGGMFILSGKELDREKDGAKIMMYSANILTLIGVIIALVALFLK